MHKKSLPTISESLQRLIALAEELASVVNQESVYSDFHRELAGQILSEIQRAVGFRDEAVVLKVFEASIVPKMVRLGKVVHFFRSLRPSAGGGGGGVRAGRLLEVREISPPSFDVFPGLKSGKIVDEELAFERIAELMSFLGSSS